ncbi:MAG: GNAT family N-acetyltransferase [Treponema sp.]|jgi:ribosomal protein S18 acetylase RimI-like enzyme|nr:GNAT family N-acetyltransferase [Treponema sp.]
MAEGRKSPFRWRRVKKEDLPLTERLLKDREPYCVAACARFLHPKGGRDHLWFLRRETPAGPKSGGNIAALLLFSRRSLFPIRIGAGEMPPPPFMNSLLRRATVHAVQGLRKEVITMETLLSGLGFRAVEDIDYDLMALDREPCPASFNRGPPALILRQPGTGDEENLYRLQAAYEQEEVLPRGAVFNALSCRRSLEHILSREHILVAELYGRIVGKINTSASSFSRYQIGGVYVDPDYRGLGIACRMAAVFARELIREGRGLSLFVKKRNAAARAVYRRIGFEVLEDYRIGYY